MRFKALLIALTVCAFGLPAAAQIEDTGLGNVDPWGMGFLDAGEPALPTDMWRASRAEDLLPLMRRVRTRGLTPAEQTLMRRMALSPARQPTGRQSADLLAERARIMFELGEANAAAQLMAELETPPRGMDAEIVAVDLNLALGNEATACRSVLGVLREGTYWAKLRAVCAGLQGNAAGAELAIEIARGQGVDDQWMFDAVFALAGDMPNRPLARYDSGVALALSAAAGLESPRGAVSLSRPDLAAAMATNPNLPPVLRVRAAGIAAEAGLMDSADYRTAFDALMADGAFKASRSVDVAMAAGIDPVKTPAQQGRAYAIALKSAMGSPARFAATSRLLQRELSRLPRTADTAQDALLFSRAALAAGDAGAAGRWGSTVAIEGAPDPDPFEAAYMDALVILGGADASAASAEYVSRKLVETAKTADQTARAARVLSLWTAFGTEVPSEARALMVSGSETPGASVKPAALAAARSAARSGAAGEAILMLVGFTNGDPSKLDVTDAIVMIDALGDIGADDAARQLALEATGYWKRAS